MHSDEKPLESLLGLRLGSVTAYFIAAAVAIVAVMLRVELADYAVNAQFIAYFPAVLIAAFVCGTGPGVLTAVLCGLGSWYLIMPLRGSWELAEPNHAYGLGMYFAIAPLGAVAVGALRRAITRQRHAEAQQQLLIAELQHRTRNLLAVIRRISEQTLRSSGSLDEFGAQFGSRLAALGRAQALASKSEAGVDLGELVRSELSAHNAEPCDARVQLSGPQLTLPSPAALTLALAVHELATNALKHGALGQDGARLYIRWDLLNGTRPPAVLIDWRESGVCMPQGVVGRAGFGRKLIEKALPYDLGATTSFDIGSDGVHCRIELPLDAR